MVLCCMCFMCSMLVEKGFRWCDFISDLLVRFRSWFRLFVLMCMVCVVVVWLMMGVFVVGCGGFIVVVDGVGVGGCGVVLVVKVFCSVVEGVG